MKASVILHPNHLSIFIFLCSLTIKVSGNSTAKEFFKLSNSETNFSMPKNIEFSPKNSTKQVVTSIIVASVVTLTILFLLGCTIFLRRRTRTSRYSDEEKRSYENKEREISHCRRFSFDEIKIATNNFDTDLKIGDGGFGRVYQGFIAGKESPVAVKVLKSTSSQGSREFWTEVETLSKLRNPNLVSLIGYCNDQRCMIIVYDYMAQGTLRDHLYGTKNPQLTWKQRLEICIGAARGLVYLHEAAEHRIIIHRDVKSSNILLDENWAAKVSDFGLSRLGPESPSRSHVTTDVKGTFGYLDPEYFWTRELTPKSDVYGFGIVMFEVLCGRPSVDMGLDEEQQSLGQWARYHVKKGSLDQIIDENLRGEISPECLKLYGKVADRCLRSERKRRPKMADVLRGLEFALRLQESADVAAKEGIEAGEGGEKMTCCVGGNLVVVRSQYKDEVVHSCPTIWKKSNSHKMLLRFFSDKAGLRWATQSTSRALRALCFVCSCSLKRLY